MSAQQAEAKPSTKQRLAAIVQGFDDFDSDMKTGTRVRILLDILMLILAIIT
jgi:hypothetical protein